MCVCVCVCAFVCSWLYVIQRLSYAAYVLFVGKSVVTTPPVSMLRWCVALCASVFLFQRQFMLLLWVACQRGLVRAPWQQHLWSRGMCATASWCVGWFCACCFQSKFARSSSTVQVACLLVVSVAANIQPMPSLQHPTNGDCGS